MHFTNFGIVEFIFIALNSYVVNITLCLKNYTLFIFAITFLFVNQFS